MIKLALPTFAFLALSGLAAAQTPPPNPSLTPPGAPADNVFKTLDQVEPRIPVNAVNTPGSTGNYVFQISSPGSYYLTSNISGVTSGDGIRIVSDGVTLDLNGFEVAGATGSGIGIAVFSSGGSNFGRVTVKGGTVTGWGGSGINATNEAVLVKDIASRGNGGTGIDNGQGMIENCIATENGGDGIRSNGIVTHCVSQNNTGYGFVILGGLATDCESSYNGEWGFRTNGGCTIARCSIQRNTKGGITLRGSANQVRDNFMRGVSSGIGTDPGISVPVVGSGGGIDNVIENNHVHSFNVGISIQHTESLIIRNKLSFNNTDFSIVTGNNVGIIVNATATTSAISGSSGGGLGAAGAALTSPFANIIL